MTKTQNKPQYLTPRINVVSFVVESGFQTSPPDVLQTSNPVASEYSDVDQGYNDWTTL